VAIDTAILVLEWLMYAKDHLFEAVAFLLTVAWVWLRRRSGKADLQARSRCKR
jgi:hypothetical protein